MDRIRRSVQALHPYVPGEQPKDPSVIKLNTNENPYPPPEAVRQALTATDPDKLRKYPDPVCRALREKLGQRYDWDPDGILVGNGSDEVLLLCMRAFCERETGSIGYFDPSYSLYPVLAAIEDLPTRAVALDEGFDWVDPPSESSVFFLTHPNAPTGRTYDPERIAAFCDHYPGVVVLDEAYADFAEWNGIELARGRKNVLITRTFSKSWSLAWIRCGFVLGPVELVQALYKIKDSYNVNGLTQSAALAALSDESWFRDTTSKIKATREHTANALRERGAEVGPSGGNFLWVKPHTPAEQVFAHLRAHNILVRYFPQGRLAPYLRITIGTDREMDALLAAWPDGRPPDGRP